MTNREIAGILSHIAEILEIKGENPFKVRAYEKASQTVETFTRELSSMKDASEIAGLPGIGSGIAGKIAELLSTGKLAYYEDLKASDYALLTEFLKIPGMGPKHAKLVYDRLGIKSLEALEQAAEAGQLRELPGMGAKLEQNILQGIRQVRKYKERLPLAFVYPRALTLLEALRQVKEVGEVALAGSLRRMRETVADVDLLVCADRPEKVMAAFAGLPQVASVISMGGTKSSVVTKDGFQADLRVVPAESFGAAVHYFTGSKAHNIRVRSLGLERGLKINEYGVFRDEKRLAGKTEEEVFACVGLPWIPPELREDQGEIEAGLEDSLPRLLDLDDLQGDLHCHTNWTDGANTLEEMALAGRKRGYRYLAICDHSPAVGVVNGLTPERLTRQMAEIDALNRRLKGFRLLKGIEVDIRANGDLDLEGAVLEKLDLVVAAVHTRLGDSREVMTRRIVRALENPHTDILGHPTGRIIGKREPYEVDLDQIMDAARANGKILELNSFPERLDLSDIHCRKAREKGVKLAISTDAHLDAHLDLIRFGVATARRGWLEPGDVMNTLPPARLLKRLGAK